MLEIDYIMGFYLLQILVLLKGTVLDELPKTLTFVLVDDRNPSLFGPFNRRTVLHIFPPLIALRQRAKLLVLIQIDILVIFCEIHEAIGIYVVDEKFVIEVDIVSVVLV